MKAQAIVRKLGGPAYVARHLKSPRRAGKPLTRAAVAKWDEIPVGHLDDLEQLAIRDGKKVRRQQMRPDIFRTLQ